MLKRLLLSTVAVCLASTLHAATPARKNAAGPRLQTSAAMPAMKPLRVQGVIASVTSTDAGVTITLSSGETFVATPKQLHVVDRRGGGRKVAGMAALVEGQKVVVRTARAKNGKIRRVTVRLVK